MTYKLRHWTFLSLRTLVCLLLIVLFLTPGNRASAYSKEDYKAIAGGTQWFKPNAECRNTGSGTTGSSANVYILGDSITVRAAESYKTKFGEGTQVSISGEESRSWNNKGNGRGVGTLGSGKDALEADSSAVSSAGKIVIALGTNGYLPSNPVDDVINAVRAKNSAAPIYWVNIANGPPGNTGVPQFNAALDEAAKAGKITVSYWSRVVDPSGDGTNNPLRILDDNTHPSIPDGVNKLTDLVVNDVKTSSTTPQPSSTCCKATTSSVPATPTPGAGLDYAGNPVFNDTQLAAIKANQPFYESAAQKVGIPWQMIAVVHSNEHNLLRDNPSNGQGVYQFYDKHGGPYPTGPVDDAEFQRQTDLAAEFLKGKNGALNTTADAAVIKDTFFSYNGRAGVYVAQATALGFPADQGYEGSPYVMNKADEKRDPSINKTTWGQIKTDGGSLSYPANDFHGAYIKYAALAGVSTAACGTSVNGTVREKVVALLKAELALWDSGEMKGGDDKTRGDYFKYSQNRIEAWCSDFASWIYNQAGYPLIDGNSGNVPYSGTVWDIGNLSQKFHAHPAGSGYQPRPGDLVVYTGFSHVEIIIDNTNGTLTAISGNWGDSVAQHSYPLDAKSVYGGHGILGYVSPD